MGQAFSARIPGQDGQLVKIGSKSAFKDINRQLYSQSEFDLDSYSPTVARPEKLTEEDENSLSSFNEGNCETMNEEDEEEDGGWGFVRWGLGGDMKLTLFWRMETKHCMEI